MKTNLCTQLHVWPYIGITIIIWEGRKETLVPNVERIQTALIKNKKLGNC